MRYLVVRTIAGVLVSVSLAPLLLAQSQNAAEFKKLQGSWTVTGGEHEGQPLDSLKGGTMTVTNQQFEIHTASGNQLKGELRLNTAKAPFRMDLIHADGKTVWEAIYEVNGDDFRLNYIQVGGKDQRPTTFTTSKESEASIILLKRQK